MPESDDPLTIANQSSGVNIDAQQITIGGDVVGRDKITQTEQVDTGGGAYIGDSVEVKDHSTFVGRDTRTVSVGGDVNAPIVLGDVYGEVHLHAAHVEIPPPPPPPPLPVITRFVGRDTELADYTQRLTEKHWVVISGMAGVGKTTFAAELARRVSEHTKVFWHAFHDGEGTQPIIWKLAGFLAWHGQVDLWRLLQRVRQTGGQSPPIETLLDYLIQMVQGQDYLLCFDDFQFVGDDPLLGQLIERLRTALVTGKFSVIMTSRNLPAFVQTVEFEALAGLSVADTRQLLITCGLVLPDALVTDLHSHTGGNAQFLMLAIDTLSQVADPSRAIQRLAETADIERYLVEAVHRRLTADERPVMSAVSVLLGHPATSSAIEAILDTGSVRLPLRNLCDRYLLAVSEGEAGREYGQHAMVRAFFYDLLGQRERQALHRRAGEYYETEGHDLLKAAIHYHRAREQAKAAQLATVDVWMMINLGQIHVLQDLLARFTADELDSELWVKVILARGQVYAVQGLGELARENYHQASLRLAELPDSLEIRKLKARACRGMGELLEQASPLEALDWLQLGLAEVAGNNDFEEAALEIKVGTVQMYLGNYADALSALDRGLKYLPAKHDQLRISALRDLGVIGFLLGDIDRAKENTLRALGISRDLHDHFQTADLLSNLGVYEFAGARWAEAIADWQQALALAERLGNEKVKVSLGVNLGAAYIYTGDDEQALNQLTNSLALARKNNLPVFESTIQFRLADLHIRLAEWDSAIAPLEEAERLAVAIDAKGNLPEVYAGWAEVKLAQGQLPDALNHARQAVSLAQDLGKDLELGISLRVLGQVLCADGQRQPAMDVFSQSLALLHQPDPYEAARTQMQWGLALLSGMETDQGMTLLKDAQSTFKLLGARRDLAAVENILQSGG